MDVRSAMLGGLGVVLLAGCASSDAAPGADASNDRVPIDGPEAAARDADEEDVVIDDASRGDAAADGATGDVTCRSAAQTACGADCVYLSFTPNHCGACGHRCPGGASCRQGECRCDGTVCGDDCVELTTSPAHCGACGRACAEGLVCRDGRCGCPAGTCGGRCVDIRIDPANCGGCGRACAATEQCQAGACVCAEQGRGSCGGAACDTDLRSDARHCGACDAACLPGRRCDQGRCALVCPRGAADCDRDPSRVCEAFVQASDEHCGACGRACVAGERCAAGRCVPTAVTPRMPGSGVAATSARPWFRWALAGGADGARVEVCADRACARVEWQAEVSGTSARPESPLAPGVHFWRAFPRRGAATDAAAGPTWEFLVPGAGVAWNLGSNGLMDLDGDGREDRVSTDAAAPDVLRVVYGGARADSLHSLPRAGDLGLNVTGYSGPTPIAAGDLDGDGFADLVTWHTTVTQYSAVGFAPGYMHMVFYGSAEGLTDRTAVFGTGPAFATSGVFQLAGFAAVGSFRGGPGGDVAIATRRMGFLESCVAALTATATGGGAGWSGACDAVTYAAGDYDADGRVDVAVWPPARVYTYGATARAIGSCAAFAWGARGEVLRAADVDVDGYDDLVRTAADGSAVMYGGPGGLDGSRCAALP